LLPDTYEAVRSHPLFRNLSTETQQQLATLLTLENYPQGETIFRFGDPGHFMYFICSGTARFVMQDYTGNEITLEEASEGDVFGEVALYNKGSRTADAVAVKPVTLLTLPEGKLAEFLRVCPEVSEYLLRRMAKRLASSSQLLRHTAQTVEEVVEAERSPEDRAILRMVENIATLPFLLTNITLIILWIVVSPVIERRMNIQLDTDVFERLGLILGIESLIVSAMVLINQRREAKEEGVRDRTEYEATLHADSAVKHLHQKIDVLIAEVRRTQSSESSKRAEEESR
jgi:CRP-like cAMP-binding protein